MSKKPKKSRSVPSVDDPTSAFPIGALSGMADDDDAEGTPTSSGGGGGGAAARPTAPKSSTGLQLRLLGISLLVGAGAATIVALLLAAAMLLAGR